MLECLFYIFQNQDTLHRFHCIFLNLHGIISRHTSTQKKNWPLFAGGTTDLSICTARGPNILANIFVSSEHTQQQQTGMELYCMSYVMFIYIGKFIIAATVVQSVDYFCTCIKGHPKFFPHLNSFSLNLALNGKRLLETYKKMILTITWVLKIMDLFLEGKKAKS